MIISASRRTDIPAFYSEWFINRIKEEKKSRLFSLNSLDLTVDCQVRVLKKP